MPQIRQSPADVPVLAEGEGLSIVVNPLGGSYSPETAGLLRKEFPKAYIHEIPDGADVAAEVAATAGRPGTRALGVWGGDGTVGSAAGTAVEQSLPLLVLPGGTLNHFARDAGITSVETAALAASQGEAVHADLGSVVIERGLQGAPETTRLSMVNTASIGVYPNLVRRRERLVPALGKPLAGLVAGIRTFAVATPSSLRLNGVRHKVWILYLGRGRYYPRDLAPLARPILDDGLFDIRMVSADEPFARLRLLWSVLTGTAATSKVTHLSEASRVVVEAEGLPLVLAVDGEPMPGVRRAEFNVVAGKLRCYSHHSKG
jgi:undecaprenyl-diphosphatase